MSESIWDASEAWRVACPGASGGVLVCTGFAPEGRPEAFDASLTETEELLRTQYGELEREAIRQTGHLAAYHRYYRSFGQNYYVQHQIESIAKKGRKFPRRQILVEIGFKWELRNGLLTGVHDWSLVAPPVILDVASAKPVSYTQYSGETEQVRNGDMYFHDGTDVLSSIVAGPCQHARVTDDTSSALVVVYGVPGLPAADIERHLQDIWDDIQAVSPGAKLIELSTRTT